MRPVRSQAGRGHWRPGTLLRRGQGHRLGQSGRATLAEADAELQRLAILKKNHADEQYIARRSVRDLPETIVRLTKRIGDLTMDLATLAAHAEDPITIGDRVYGAEDELKALGRVLNTIPDRVHETRRHPLGVYRGLQFGLVLHPQGAPDAYLEGAATRHGQLARDAGPRAFLNALDRLAGSYEAQAATARKDLAIAEGQLRDYQARLGKPFAHEAIWRNSLNSATSSRPACPGQRRSRERTRSARCRDRRADQGPEIRPHHRARPGADQGTQHRHGRGAGHGTHPPPGRGHSRTRAGQ